VAVVVLAAVEALDVVEEEEEWVIEVALMMTIRDMDLAMDLVAVDSETTVVLVAGDLDRHVVAVVDSEGMLLVLQLDCLSLVSYTANWLHMTISPEFFH